MGKNSYKEDIIITKIDDVINKDNLVETIKIINGWEFKLLI